jgi:hypothetical protein
METNPDFLAPCGVYCETCRIYRATRDNDHELIKKLLDAYEGKISGLEKISEEDGQCEGCLSEDVSIFCRECSVKDCTREKGYSGCHECDDFPCQLTRGIIHSGVCVISAS